MSLKLHKSSKIKWRYFSEGVKLRKGDQWLVNVRDWSWEETIDAGRKSDIEMIYRRQTHPKTPTQETL